MFNIPQNTKGSMSLGDLASASMGGQPVQQVQPQQQSQPNWGTPPQQQAQPNWGTPPQQAQPNWGAQPAQQGVTQPQQQQSQQPNWGTPPQQQAQTPQQSQPLQVQPTAPQVARPQGGGVSLAKGQKVSLTKMNPNLSQIGVGLGWDVTAQGYDLDSEAFLLGENGKVVGDDWFVFYNQPCSPDGAVKHSGDNRTGEGTGDDEVIDIDLTRLNPNVAKIVFIVSIDGALEKGYNFSNVANAYVRVWDKSTGKELVRFNLTDYYKEVTSMVVGELYLKGGEWRFNPVGNGVAQDLAGLCIMYGVNLA